MPEQLTKHPEVTLQVLRSGAAQCGEGLPQSILTQCAAERFCKLPGGEICVYGLPEAGRMTQVTMADWRAVLAAPNAAPATSALGVELWLAGGAGLVVGVVLAAIAPRLRTPRR